MYLADTHVLIWARGNPARLSRKARAVVEDRGNQIYFSIASIWEIAIKVSIGKLRIDGTVQELVGALVHDGFEMLPVRVAHVLLVADLPLHHRDPFDRMLIAQAREEDLELITADSLFDEYPVGTLW